MIALASNYLLFELACGETVPFSAEDMSIEVCGDSAALFDSEFVRHAANAVFHYFKYELERQTVSVEEFSGALEKILNGFALRTLRRGTPLPAPAVLESDLRRLAGARRWSGRCRKLEEQIIDYLRECLTAEPKKMELALVVD